MSEALNILVIAIVIILMVSIGLLLLTLMTQGAIILYRKFSSNWVHCNKCDSWRKIEIEAETEEQTEE